MRFARRWVVAVLVLATCATPSLGLAAALTLHYDVYYLAFRIVSVDVASRMEPMSYSTSVALRTAGLFSTFVPWQSNVTVSGTIDGPTLRPLAYRARSTYRDRNQRIDLEYKDAGSTVLGEVDGNLTDDPRTDVPEPLRSDTMDPVSAGAAVAQRVVTTGTCAGTIRIFDGLRRYDLRYTDLGMTELDSSSRDPYQGSARLCRARVESIAGFLRSGEHADERATELSAWIAPPLPGAKPVAVRMELWGPRGTLRVHLARATEGVS